MKKIIALLVLILLSGLGMAQYPTNYMEYGPYSQGYYTGPVYSYYGNTPSVFYYPMYDPMGGFYAVAAWDQQARTWQYGNGQETWGSGYARYNPYG